MGFRKLFLSTSSWPLLVVPTILLPLSCGGGSPDVLPGAYQGEGVLLKIHREEGEAWGGRLQVAGVNFPVEGKLVGSELQGFFGKGERRFPFVLKKAKSGFLLESQGNRHQLTLLVPKNPLAKPKPKAPSNPQAKPKARNPLAGGGGRKGMIPPEDEKGNRQEPKAAPDPLKAKTSQDPASVPGANKIKVAAPPSPTLAGKVAVSGKLYKHPLGFRFRYPDGWQIKKAEGGEGLLLVPSDVAKGPYGIEEVIVVAGEEAPGITDVTDGRISGSLDRDLSQIFPFLKRKNPVKKLAIRGRDFALHEWEGKNPRGKKFSGLALSCLLQGYSLGVVAVLPTERMAGRRPVLEAIAGSIHYKEPERDKALVGVWRYQSFYSSGTFGSTTVRVLELRPDGSSLWRSRLLLSMEHKNSYGDPTGSTTGDTGRDKGLSGRWSAQDRKLVLQWANGNTEEYSYYQEKGSMLMTPKGSKRKQLWKKIR